MKFGWSIYLNAKYAVSQRPECGLRIHDMVITFTALDLTYYGERPRLR